MAIIRNYPDTARNRLLENVAALIFGRDPDSVAPDIGWRATLARHLGMNKNAVSDTMRQPGSPKFDHRLADFVSRKRIAMSRNAIILEHDEVELRGADNPVMKLWIVQITTPVGRSTRLVWGCHAGEVAAFLSMARCQTRSSTSSRSSGRIGMRARSLGLIASKCGAPGSRSLSSITSSTKPVNWLTASAKRSRPNMLRRHDHGQNLEDHDRRRVQQ